MAAKFGICFSCESAVSFTLKGLLVFSSLMATDLCSAVNSSNRPGLSYKGSEDNRIGSYFQPVLALIAAARAIDLLHVRPPSYSTLHR